MVARAVILATLFSCAVSLRERRSTATEGSNITAKVAAADFCWKDTTTRGVGRIPSRCGSGQDRIGLLCYDKCRAGWARFGYDCHTSCPEGLRNDGLYCRKTEYGRGVGYPLWKEAKCKRENPTTGCERCLAIHYPRCRPGYRPFGCNICRPDRPNCPSLGLDTAPLIPLSCRKRIQIGRPRFGSCSSTEDKDAGLCYPKCASGFRGVGPVCWGKPPSGWTQCGMGAARSGEVCKKVIVNQVFSVGKLAMTVATFGASMAGPDSQFAEIKKQFEKVKEIYESLKEKYPQIKEAEEKYRIVHGTQNVKETITEALRGEGSLTAADLVRIGASMAACVDESGISSTIAAYSYARCSRYFR